MCRSHHFYGFYSTRVPFGSDVKRWLCQLLSRGGDAAEPSPAVSRGSAVVAHDAHPAGHEIEPQGGTRRWVFSVCLRAERDSWRFFGAWNRPGVVPPPTSTLTPLEVGFSTWWGGGVIDFGGVRDN